MDHPYPFRKHLVRSNCFFQIKLDSLLGAHVLKTATLVTLRSASGAARGKVMTLLSLGQLEPQTGQDSVLLLGLSSVASACSDLKQDFSSLVKD